MNLQTYFETKGRGSAISLAKAVGAFSSDMSSWTQGKRPVPAERCPQIEAATGGLVRCEDLRPDVQWSVLRNTPELAQATVFTEQAATQPVAIATDTMREGTVRRQETRRAGEMAIPL